MIRKNCEKGTEKERKGGDRWVHDWGKKERKEGRIKGKRVWIGVVIPSAAMHTHTQFMI